MRSNILDMNFHKTVLPRIKKKIQLYDREHHYYKCWNCGFVCDSKRDIIVDHYASVPTEYTDTDGSTAYYSDITGNCPLCGAQYK